MLAVAWQRTMASARPKFREPPPQPVRRETPEELARKAEAEKRRQEERRAALLARIEEALAEARERRKFVSARSVIALVAQKHGVSVEDILSHRRTRALSAVRFEAVKAVAEARPDLSLPRMGRIFHRDHSSLIHSLRRAKELGL